MGKQSAPRSARTLDLGMTKLGEGTALSDADIAAITDSQLALMVDKIGDYESMKPSGETQWMAAMKSFQETIEFRGFDVDFSRRVCIAAYEKCKATTTSVYIAEDKEIVLDSFFRHMDVICVIFNTIGNNINGALESIKSAEGKESLTKFLNAYNLQPKVMTNATDKKKKETLTPARVVACWSCRGVMLAAYGFAKSVYETNKIYGARLDKLTMCGKALAHSMSASLLTAAMINKGYHYLTFAGAIEINKIIGEKKQTWDKGWGYHLAMLKSAGSPEELRENFWKELDLQKEDFTARIDAARKMVLGNLLCSEDRVWFELLALYSIIL